MKPCITYIKIFLLYSLKYIVSFNIYQLYIYRERERERERDAFYETKSIVGQVT